MEDKKSTLLDKFSPVLEKISTTYCNSRVYVLNMGAMDWRESIKEALVRAHEEKLTAQIARDTKVDTGKLKQLRLKGSLNAEELILVDKWLIDHGFKRDTLGVFGASRPPDILSLTGVKLEAIGRILQDTALDDEARIEELGSIVPLSKRLQSLVAAFKKGNEIGDEKVIHGDTPKASTR